MNPFMMKVDKCSDVPSKSIERCNAGSITRTHPTAEICTQRTDMMLTGLIGIHRHR